MSSEHSGQQRRIELFMQSVQDLAVILFDSQGLIVEWNIGARLLFGWTPAEVVGKPGDLIFTPEDRAAGVPQMELTASLVRGGAPDERWHVRKDDTRFWASGVMTPLRDDHLLVGFAKVIRDMTADKLNRDRLEASESRLKNTFAYAAVGVALLDSDAHFLEVNPAYCRIMGRTVNQLQRSDLLSITHPEDRSSVTAALGQLACGSTPSTVLEVRVVQPDGRTTWVRHSISGLEGSLRPTKEMITIAEDISNQIGSGKQTVAASSLGNHDLRALTDQLLTAEAEQRRHLAHELHEDAAQRAAALRLELNGLTTGLSPEQFQERSASLQAMADGLATELLRISYTLYPSTLEHLGLEITLRKLTQEFTETWTQKVSFTSDEVLPQIPGSIGLALYRVAQEALRMVTLQAPGTCVSIALNGVEEQTAIELMFETSGPGSTLIQPRFAGGIEIVSIQERVRLLCGVMRLESTSAGENRLTIRVPLPPAQSGVPRS